MQIEADVGLTEEQYHMLNAAYFGPNIILPVVWGFVAQHVGPARTQCGLAALIGLGGVLCTHGFASRRYSPLLFGRLMMGVAYEGLDAMWVSLVTPHVPRRIFATVCSFINASQRGGSVFAFLLSPRLYSAFGLLHAAVVVSALGMAAILPAGVALRLSGTAPAASTDSDAPAGKVPVAADGKGSGVEDAPAGVDPLHALSLRGFGSRFWIFNLCATLIYAAVVPFWFIGSKLLQQPPWSLSVETADAYILLPELAVLLIGPLAAVAADMARLTTTQRAAIPCISQPLLAVAYALLLRGGVPPSVPLSLLGLAWGCSHALFWGLLPTAVPSNRLAVGAGIAGVCVNIGPTLLPLLLALVGEDGEGGALATKAMLAISLCSAASFGMLMLDSWPTRALPAQRNSPPPFRHRIGAGRLGAGGRRPAPVRGGHGAHHLVRAAADDDADDTDVHMT